MRQFLAYVAVFFILTPLAVHADEGTITLDSETAEIAYDAQNITVAKAYFDADFESLVFEIKDGQESGTLVLQLDRELFAHPGTLDEYYVQVDAEPADAVQEQDGKYTKLSITIKPGVTDIEVFGTVLAVQPVEEIPEPVVDKVKEEPAVTEPKEEPTVTEPKEEPEIELETQCEPGTVLEDGICIAEQTEKPICGPGTVLKDGKCVIKPASASGGDEKCIGEYLIFSCFKDLAYGAIGAVAIALIIAFILLGFSRISGKRN